MSEVEDRFMRRLLERFPEFRADLDDEWAFYVEHKPEGFFEPPTAADFLSALADNLVRQYFAGGTGGAEQFRALAEYLESQLGADAAIDELIEHSFVQFMPEPGGRRAQVLELLGPRLRADRLRMHHEAQDSVPESTVRFLDRLVEAVPALRDRLRGTIEMHGLALPHTFMDDVTVEAVRLHVAGQSALIRPLLEFLEAEFGTDEYVDNVIAVSFVETLPEPGRPGADIETLLGPKLRAELDRQRTWSESSPDQTG